MFSDRPNLGNEYFEGESHLRSTEDRALAALKGIHLFVLQGLQDRNCSFAVTREVVDELTRAGARVKLGT